MIRLYMINQSQTFLCRWSLRERPKEAAAKFVGLKAAIRGLAQIGEHQLLAASKEGLLCIWKLQQPDSPLFYVDVPSNRQALAGMSN